MTHPMAIGDGITEAARWHLLARLFERPHGSWHAAVDALATEVGDAALRALAVEATSAAEGTYLALLGPGGIVSAREVGHTGAFRDPGWVLSELRRFYDAFGYEPCAEDPLDHAVVELGFVAYLHLKEAHARAVGDDAAVQVTVEARTAFVHQHLAPFMVSMARRLEGAPGHLAATATLAASRLPEVPAMAGGVLADPLETGCGGCV